MLYFDDIHLHEIQQSTATHWVTAEDIKRFASEWDPMPFHLDEEVAKLTPMGRLFASGAHNIAISIKLSHTMMERQVAAIAGLGWQDVRFPLPVFAGDVLHLRTEIVDKRVSQSKPDRGIITTLITLLNQDDAVVTEYKILTMVLRKP
ncbi:MAG TPA: MaoC/PaaZ C-terminal domain-containing protein [Pseudomonadales bacterium]|nr:MaoC/PaaZ C-terminal domain-containing protein [Pseudomonadales bacterium]